MPPEGGKVLMCSGVSLWFAFTTGLIAECDGFLSGGQRDAVLRASFSHTRTIWVMEFHAVAITDIH